MTASNGTTHLFDATGTELAVLSGPQGVTDPAFSPHGSVIYS
jgi:hypothetical protein